MADRDTIDVVIEELAKALTPLRQAVSSADAFAGFAAQLGWSIDDIPAPLQTLIAPLDDLIDALGPIVAGREPGLLEYDALRQAITNVATAIDALEGASYDPALAAEGFATIFPRQLTQYLIVRYLIDHRPALAFVLRVLGLMRVRYVPRAGARLDHTRWELAWPDFTELLRDPAIVFRRAAAWGTAEFAAYEVLEAVQDFMTSIGAPSVLEELDPQVARILENGIDVPGDPVRWHLRIPLFSRASATGVVAAGIGVFPLPADGALLPGLALLPSADASITGRFEITDRLFLTIEGTLDLLRGVGVLVRPDRAVEVVAGLTDGSPAPVTGALSIRLDHEQEEPRRLIALRNGSRLEFARLSAVGGLRLAGDQVELFTEIELHVGRLVIAHEAGDSFLQNVTPPDDLAIQFDIALGLSTTRGLYFRGSSLLEREIPTHLSVGPIEVQSISIAVRPDGDQIPILVGASLSARLGPITATVTGIGLRARLAFPGSGGNLGPLDVDLDFKPPEGIGLVVDGGGFKGGGFLEFEPEEARYSGMLELEFQDQFTVKAFGLLNTRLPNGQSGFSLLIVISSEFTPIQLGLGFKLNGVGGLLGLNRTVNIEPLRAGLRANTLSSILFPTDIVANADRIISDLKQIFPPQADRFIFGSMAKIAWGTPTLVTIDLGLVIEIPDPVRLLILGVLRAVLPDEKAMVLQVQVNFLGEINFERRQLKFDASLFDSKLLGFNLSGDMAIRLDWGADANFLLTVGGFHPAYEPPPMDLPAIRRLTLALLSGDNPRLRLEMYFAVTSNTAQFGAKLELYASASAFNVFGLLSFDVLFQFNPFYFIAEITAMLALRIGSSSFASIKLTLTLEGPTPWKAKGTASFKICWFFTLKVRFNKTFGETRNTTLPDLAVLPLLAEALRANDNWEGELPVQRHRLESIREAPELAGELVLHPVGTLRISQKVVPLNVAIDRIGSQRPSDGREFRIVNPQPEVTTNTPQEAFAPAQFFDLTDEQKLTSASFKDLDSGVRVGDAAQLHTGYAAAREVEYEVKYIDSQRDQRLAPPRGSVVFPVDAGAFNTWTLQGAIAQSQISFARKRKSSLAPEAVVVSQEPFAIVNSGDLQLFDASSLLGSELAAVARLNELTRTNPNLRGTLQVVPAFELAA